jgi:hypothetical protein
MSTLTTQGITWQVGRYNGRACFTHNNLTITFHPSVGEYTVWCDKREWFSDSRIDVCLESATLATLDTYASQFAPMWENEESPDTERNPRVYEEVCHAAE